MRYFFLFADFLSVINCSEIREHKISGWKSPKIQIYLINKYHFSSYSLDRKEVNILKGLE